MCRRELVCEHSLKLEECTDAYSYLADLDGGGLKWPTDFSLKIVTWAFMVFGIVVSEDYESLFLKVSNQKSVLFMLISEQYKEYGVVEQDFICGISMSTLADLTLRL
jgi:hypothetical protein